MQARADQTVGERSGSEDGRQGIHTRRCCFLMELPYTEKRNYVKPGVGIIHEGIRLHTYSL